MWQTEVQHPQWWPAYFVRKSGSMVGESHFQGNTLRLKMKGNMSKEKETQDLNQIRPGSCTVLFGNQFWLENQFPSRFPHYDLHLFEYFPASYVGSQQHPSTKNERSYGQLPIENHFVWCFPRILPAFLPLKSADVSIAETALRVTWGTSTTPSAASRCCWFPLNSHGFRNEDEWLGWFWGSSHGHSPKESWKIHGNPIENKWMMTGGNTLLNRTSPFVRTLVAKNQMCTFIHVKTCMFVFIEIYMYVYRRTINMCDRLPLSVDITHLLSGVNHHTNGDMLR